MSTRPSRRVHLDSPNHSMRSAPLMHRAGGPQITTSTTADWERRSMLRQAAPSVLARGPLAGLRQMRQSPPRQDPYAVSIGLQYRASGRSDAVERPLESNDLYMGPDRPPAVDGVHEEHLCNICLCLKSHPVTYASICYKLFCTHHQTRRYMCGHGHCYVCVRLWLERDWRCPECRSAITSPPFRVISEEKSIERIHGDWDNSVVLYDWSGLRFPAVSFLV